MIFYIKLLLPLIYRNSLYKYHRWWYKLYERELVERLGYWSSSLEIKADDSHDLQKIKERAEFHLEKMQ